MPCIEVSDTIPTGLKASEQQQVYNGLDACITAELVPVMLPLANENHLQTYDREMRLQSLCLEMSTKGFPVNQMRVLDLLKELDNEAAKALAALHAFCDAIWASRINPNSPIAVANFFYEFLALPVIWVWDHATKQRKRSTNRDSLEKLRMYPTAIPFVNAILTYRETTKLAGVFKKGLEPSGVLRCNFSPSGTETGRLSSQTNPYQRGTNAQNLADRVRQVVEAPPGYVLAYIDLKTAESFAVGYLSGDRDYIAACYTGDLHTSVSELIWPELGWQQGDLAYNRKLADKIFYRDMTYRDMTKRGGHGTNYYGTARTMAMHLKVATGLIEAFQNGYFNAFPGIPHWHLSTIARIQREGTLVTPLNRERRFWGRSSDAATHREAIAFAPQSLVADCMNEGLMAVQRWLLKEIPHVHELPVRVGHTVAYTRGGLLAQIHDAGLFILPASEADSIIPEILRRIIYPVDFGPLGVMSIPAEAEVGRRWSKRKGARYPDGLRSWTPGMDLSFV